MYDIKKFKDAEVELSDEISYFTIIECILTLGASIWQGLSLRAYFRRKNIK